MRARYEKEIAGVDISTISKLDSTFCDINISNS
jgi:hypothetical protein